MDNFATILLVIAFGKHMASRGLRTLCDGPATPTQWKSVTDQPTNGLTGVGAKDAYESKDSVSQKSEVS